MSMTIELYCTPPDPDDPEARIIHMERCDRRQAARVYALERLGAHRYGPAFVAYLVHGKTWAELETIHGVLAGTLRRTFHRAVEQLVADCSRRFQEEDSRG